MKLLPMTATSIEAVSDLLETEPLREELHSAITDDQLQAASGMHAMLVEDLDAICKPLLKHTIEKIDTATRNCVEFISLVPDEVVDEKAFMVAMRKQASSAARASSLFQQLEQVLSEGRELAHKLRRESVYTGEAKTARQAKSRQV